MYHRVARIKTCYANHERTRGRINSHLSQLRAIIAMHPRGVGVRAEELRGWLKVTPRRVTYAPATSNEDLSPGAASLLSFARGARVFSCLFSP